MNLPSMPPQQHFVSLIHIYYLTPKLIVREYTYAKINPRLADSMTPHLEQSDRNNSPRRNLPRSSSPYPGRGRQMTRRRYSRSPDQTPSRSPHRDVQEN
ncbi:hypothetical protein LAZ67_12000750 [Cordylochernes scorpioides]|uniref:Uncharacterized protein n=1 Tax=Cordylochernes scorpioides TaxID=51811 RepID=A0ABY6L2Q0_9ARAC|nr:hypothetical protein LAZ67_12000750 [Cordylochernes scorpioides]